MNEQPEGSNMRYICLDTDSDGTGCWTITHPMIGTLYHIEVIADNEDMGLQLTDLRNDAVIDCDSFLVSALDELIEEADDDRAFRQMIESMAFDDLEPADRELFLASIASKCLQWILDRKNL